MPEILYLSEAEVEAVGLQPAEILDCIEATFRAKTAGTALSRPKLTISPSPGDLAEALVGISLADALAGCKWVTVKQANAARGLPSVQARIATGYGLSGLPEEYRDRPVLRKPFQLETLAQVIDSTLKNAAA